MASAQPPAAINMPLGGLMMMVCELLQILPAPTVCAVLCCAVTHSMSDPTGRMSCPGLAAFSMLTHSCWTSAAAAPAAAVSST